jgi:multiple sugar transport system substrate-binding protein
MHPTILLVMHMVSRKPTISSQGRRRFIQSAGAAGVIALAGCTGGNGNSGNGGGSGNSGNGGGDGGATAGSNNSGTTTLEFWTLFTGGDGEAMIEIIEQFNEAHDDVQIKRQRQPLDQYYEKLGTAMSGGNAPDISVMHSSKQLRFADGLIQLDDYADPEPYLETTWDRVAPTGTHYGLPLGTFAWGLYYNKDIFEEAGLDPEKPPTNYAELESKANTIVNETDKLAFHPSPYGQYNRAVIGHLAQAGTSTLNEDKTGAGFDNEDGYRTGRFYRDIAENGWDKADSSANRGNKAFRAGDLAMVINGTWYQLLLRKEDVNFGHGKGFIMPNRQQKKNWGDTHIINIPKQGGLSDSEIQTRVNAIEWITQEGGSIWGGEAGHIPTTKAAMESDAVRNSEIYDLTLKNYIEMAENDQIEYWPVVENRTDYVRPLNNFFAQIYAHQMEPEEGVKKAAQQLNRNLSG